MRIKLTKTALLTGKSEAQPRGSVHEVDDAEGKALVTVGYATETKAALTDEAEPAFAASAPAVGNVSEAKAVSNAPANKAK